MYKHFIYILLFLIQFGFSQTKQIDSLSKLLRTDKGNEYFQNTNTLAEAYLEYDPSKSLALVSGILSENNLGKNEKGRALFIKGKALSVKSDYRGAVDSFDSAVAIFKEEGLKREWGRCLVEKGAAYGYMGQYDEAQKALDQSEAIFKEIEYRPGLAQALHNKGHLMYLKADDKEALALYIESLAIQEEEENDKGISDNYFRMALAHLGLGDREKALHHLVKAKDLKELIGDNLGLAKVKISLGVMHQENGNPETAIKYYLESLLANKDVGDQRVNSVIFNNLGVTYTDLKQYDSALVYHGRALDIRKDLAKPRGVIQSLMNIGEVHQIQKGFEQALENYREAYKLSHTTANKPVLAGVTDRLGDIFLEQGELDSASVYLNESLRIKQANDNYFSLSGTYNNLSQLEERRGNFEQALAYHKLFKKVRDSSLQVNASKELAEVQAKYDTERQEREIADLQQENEKRTLWRNIFAVGTLLTLGLALLLFQFFMYRNKKNKELLAAKETQREELEKLDRMKSRFFSNISHEFRTPLTLILGPLDKIRKSVDGSLQPTVDMIERNGNRLLKLINQLLDLSKIESGKVSLKASLVDVLPLIKGWVMSFHSIAESRNIKLTVGAERDSHFVYVDGEKLEEVIINLLSNAFKYTPDGGKVKISLEDDKTENQLKISVSDTGTGIPEQEQERIFDRFYQASNADTEDVTGTGIGLSLIKELVELHKGEVKVKSKVGTGTTFEVLLPLGKSHLSEDEVVAISQPMEVSEVQQINRPKVEEAEVVQIENDIDLPMVLMIEDNADLRTYIKEILRPHYQVLEAINGQDGLALAKEHIPDLVISDLMMPKMDGLEVCRRLKEEMLTCHIPIILLTAKSSKEDKLEGLRSHADDYLTKPFDTDELLVRLENLIALRKKIQSKFKAVDILSPKKVHMSSLDTIFMEKVTEQLESEISNSLFGVVELAYAVGLSRSQLFRKIKAITDLTPNEYIRSFRLYRAMDLLKQKSGSVSEIAYETGFQTPSYFSKCFQEQFGVSPSAVSK